MSKSNENSITVRKGHGTIIKALEIRLTVGTCLTLKELLDEAADNQRTFIRETFGRKKDDIMIGEQEHNALDFLKPVNDTLKLIDDLIAPALSAIGKPERETMLKDFTEESELEMSDVRSDK